MQLLLSIGLMIETLSHSVFFPFSFNLSDLQLNRHSFFQIKYHELDDYDFCVCIAWTDTWESCYSSELNYKSDFKRNDLCIFIVWSKGVISIDVLMFSWFFFDCHNVDWHRSTNYKTNDEWIPLNTNHLINWKRRNFLSKTDDLIWLWWTIEITVQSKFHTMSDTIKDYRPWKH